MKPDYEKAAIKASEILKDYKIGTAPVDPLPILKNTPGVLVMTFEEMSNKTNRDRDEILDTLGCSNQDAVTTVFVHQDKLQYIVTYNRLLPSAVIDRALARELGHVILGHDGTKPEDVRNEEARAFAHHLLCPRPLISLIRSAGIRLTVDFISKTTGFDSHCLSCIRNQPAVTVPAELNSQVRDQFVQYVQNLIKYQKYASEKDESPLADLGSYMDNYTE